MKKERRIGSSTDGSVENVPSSQLQLEPDTFVPLYQDHEVEVLTLEGLEKVTRKKLIGFRKKES